MYKPLSGDFYAQIMLQRHFYTAEFAVYITLGVRQSVVRYPGGRKTPMPNTVPRRILSAELLTRTMQGQQVLHVSMIDTQQLIVHFANGATLAVDASSVEFSAAPKSLKAPGVQSAQQPTKRQFEYLAFIHKYIARFGRAPAESDIERHFLVSAPSVNQMMQTLERLGFIARQRGVPRSVRICIELPQHSERQ